MSLRNQFAARGEAMAESGASPVADDRTTFSLVTRVGLIAATTCMAVIVALHLGLLNYGAWGADEYAAISHYREQGAGYLWFRFWSWSPRPLSEALFWPYAFLVVSTGKTLIVPALLGFWLVLIAAPAPLFYRCAPASRAPRVLGAATLLACIVLGRHVAAVLYWPLGAVAYAPVIAAFVFVFCYLANDRTRGKNGGLALMLALIVAAWSSEPGALVTMIFCGLVVACQVLRARTDPAIRRQLAWWIAPMLASLAVIWMIAFNSRASYPMPPGGEDTYYHHTIASLRAALPLLPQEFVTLDGETFDQRNFIRGALVKLLFFIGMHCAWMSADRTARPDRAWLPVLALSIVIAMFGMVAGSFQQFGAECCDRHAFVRQALGLIAIASVAISIPPLIASLHRWRLIVAPATLMGAALLLLQPRITDLREDYRFYAEPARDRARTAESASSPGPEMTMYLPFSDRLFPSQIPAGHQIASDSWWAPGILAYFGKESVTVSIAPARGH